MRHVPWALAFLTGVLAAGCSGTRFGHIRPNQGSAATAEKPAAADLVAYLKRNSDQIQSLQCNAVDISYRQGLQSYGADAKLACEKPRNFRLGVFAAFGAQQVDLGSNAKEFWYWIARSDPAYVFRCSHEDFERGVELPFPFQPEWIMEGLGMGTYGPPEKYRVQDGKTVWQLVEQTQNSQGQVVQKVTEFSKAPRLQVRGYKLLDARGKEIYTAQVDDVHVIGGVVVPRRVAFNWPEQKLSLTMRIGQSADQVVLNGRIPPERAAELFSRGESLRDIPTVDLAEVSRRAAGRIQPAGGPMR